MRKQRVDWPSFIASVAIILAASVTLVLLPESGAEFLTKLYSFISGRFAFLYLLAGVATLLLLVWLAVGRYGKIRLATDDEPPEFSTLSWAAITFSKARRIRVPLDLSTGCSWEDPARWHRLFWAVGLVVLPLTLMFLGGLKTIQSATLIVSLPLIFVGVLMAVSLVKQLQADHE